MTNLSMNADINDNFPDTMVIFMLSFVFQKAVHSAIE